MIAWHEFIYCSTPPPPPMMIVSALYWLPVIFLNVVLSPVHALYPCSHAVGGLYSTKEEKAPQRGWVNWQRFPNQEGTEQNSHYVRGFVDGRLWTEADELPQNHKKMEPIGSGTEVVQTLIHPLVLDSPFVRESVQRSSVEKWFSNFLWGRTRLFVLFIISNCCVQYVYKITLI